MNAKQITALTNAESVYINSVAHLRIAEHDGDSKAIVANGDIVWRAAEKLNRCRRRIGVTGERRNMIPNYTPRLIDEVRAMTAGRVIITI